MLNLLIVCDSLDEHFVNHIEPMQILCMQYYALIFKNNCMFITFFLKWHEIRHNVVK